MLEVKGWETKDRQFLGVVLLVIHLLIFEVSAILKKGTKERQIFCLTGENLNMFMSLRCTCFRPTIEKIKAFDCPAYQYCIFDVLSSQRIALRFEFSCND